MISDSWLVLIMQSFLFSFPQFTGFRLTLSGCMLFGAKTKVEIFHKNFLAFESSARRLTLILIYGFIIQKFLSYFPEGSHISYRSSRPLHLEWWRLRLFNKTFSVILFFWFGNKTRGGKTSQIHRTLHCCCRLSSAVYTSQNLFSSSFCFETKKEYRKLENWGWRKNLYKRKETFQLITVDGSESWPNDRISFVRIISTAAQLLWSSASLH